MHRLITLFIALLMWMVFIGTGSAAAQSDTVTMSASVDGRDVASASINNPLPLEPGKSVDVSIELTNGTTEPVDIRRIVLRGKVLGLTFFTYASSLDFTVAPASSGVLTYRLDLTDLGGQATGLIKGEFSAIDSTGNAVASVGTINDVRGSLMSVYGLFGIALVALTALGLLDAALAIARRRLSTNRWKRGLRLLAPGVGIGLILAFTASVARLWVPNTGQWLLIAGVTAAGFFALGYLSPTPEAADNDSVPDDEFDGEFDDEFDGEFDDGTDNVDAEPVSLDRAPS
jgi:hypothetical protein